MDSFYWFRNQFPGRRPFESHMQLASSGVGDSDIDVFFYGLTPAGVQLNKPMRS